MKVILDANVFVSAAIQRGPSYRIVDSWFAGTGDFEIVMCPELLGEIRDVLTTRPRLRKWISLQDASLFIGTIEVLVDLVPDPVEVLSVTRDSGDDYLIALARLHCVKMIVSGDKDLLEWSSQSPTVVTPAAFDESH